nr:hypothetical protein Iba_scaffold528953CG0010 [Ipomoea batatas]
MPPLLRMLRMPNPSFHPAKSHETVVFSSIPPSPWESSSSSSLSSRSQFGVENDDLSYFIPTFRIPACSTGGVLGSWRNRLLTRQSFYSH